jgi:acyl dehydratase
LRFIKPVFIGDTIRVTVTIDEKREDPKRPGQGFVDEKCTVANQRDETVLVFTHVLSVEKEPSREATGPA